MVKPVHSVEYNDEGTHKFGIVTGQGASGPGHYDGVFLKQGGEWETFTDAPEGTESGTWR